MTEPGNTFLLDVNVLVALAVDSHTHAEAARSWARTTRSEPHRFATTPVTESGLIRLLLNPHVFGSRLDGSSAVAQLQQMKAAPGWVFLTDDSSLAEPHIGLATLAGRAQVTDLHLVNLAARHGARLATLDRAIPTYLEPADRRFVELIPVD